MSHTRMIHDIRELHAKAGPTLPDISVPAALSGDQVSQAAPSAASPCQ